MGGVTRCEVCVDDICAAATTDSSRADTAARSAYNARNGLEPSITSVHGIVVGTPAVLAPPPWHNTSS